MKSRALRRIVMLAVPPIEELDVVGPWDVFSTANNALGQEGPLYALELATTGSTLSTAGDTGLTLSATRNYKEVRGDIDTLMVPGGTGPQAPQPPPVRAWLRKLAQRTRRIASVCTGAFLLADAGLLDGKRVTTHWMFAKDLARRYPALIVEPDRIYTQEGRFYTSAGVTAGMDLALALVEEDLGSALALKVARALVFFLRRPGGQNQFSALLSPPASGSKPLRDLQFWCAENLQQNLSVENLASRVAMSPRNFARVFVREFATTPAAFVESLRIDASRGILETTPQGLKEIAAAVGFHSAEVMRRAFQRGVGISPERYRERFAHQGAGSRRASKRSPKLFPRSSARRLA